MVERKQTRWTEPRSPRTNGCAKEDSLRSNQEWGNQGMRSGFGSSLWRKLGLAPSSLASHSSTLCPPASQASAGGKTRGEALSTVHLCPPPGHGMVLSCPSGTITAACGKRALPGSPQRETAGTPFLPWSVASHRQGGSSGQARQASNHRTNGLLLSRPTEQGTRAESNYPELTIPQMR